MGRNRHKKRGVKKKPHKKPSRKRKGKTSATKASSANGKSSDAMAVPDRRAMEGMMAGLFGGFAEGPVEAAQDVMYEAWGSQDPKRRLALACKALDISPDCADAYVLLAQESAESLEEALDLYRKGVQAGERALGKKGFKEYAGHFWGFIETRPYMRARAGLAQCLWESGKRQEAVEHYWAMLELNPGDNQGMRDLLMPCLIEMGRDEDAERLFMQYEEDAMAAWAWSRVLLDFRAGGDSSAARESLEAAVENNRHVPALLTGRNKVPRHPPAFHGFGDKNEAVCYVLLNRQAWQASPGAIAWLAANTS
ncbi:MAG: BTAD domain-containing putative transcriptional regulator [Phycisphaerae bacterium]